MSAFFMRLRLSLIAILLFALPYYTLPVHAAANILEKIEMNVYINPAGDAEVEEIWYAAPDAGTEGYKPYGNMGMSRVTDFTVSDDSGAVYAYTETWDPNAGFEGKKYKNGIVDTPSGVELCWGISAYGQRVYTLRYTITHFVNQYNDAQGVYFSLMPREMDQSPGSVVITLACDTPLSAVNAGVWGFGYGNGSAVFNDGAVVMDSNGVLHAEDYMTLLLRFEDGLFETANPVDKDFDEVFDQAMQGVDPDEIEKAKNEYAGGSPDELSSDTQGNPIRGGGGESAKHSGREGTRNSFVVVIIIIIFMLSLPLLIILWVLQRMRNAAPGTRIKGGLDFGPAGNKSPSIRDTNYWREIPCNKDLLLAYWVMEQYRVGYAGRGGDLQSGLIGAILLQWLKQGRIRVVRLPKKFLSLKDNQFAIDISTLTSADNEPEIQLLAMFKSAADGDEILKPKQFAQYCTRHYEAVEEWFNEVTAFGTASLTASGMITVTQVEVPDTFLGIKLRSTHTVTVQHVDACLYDEAVRLQGLKKFLLEFSTIDRCEAFEEALWEDYMIFAQLFGIADKVREQLDRVYSNFEELTAYDMEVATVMLMSFANTGCRAARDAREAANNSSSYDGGGGSSFSDGGSGASGSSSGGGFR